MATIWTGAVSFGMVTIPVKLTSAVRTHDLSFKTLHPETDEEGRETLCPVGIKRYCKKDDQIIPWTEVVKGYEVADGEYVVLDDDDFEQAAEATSKTFDIEDFTPLEQIDPRFFEKPYFLVPGEGAAKAYALLRDTMRETAKVGIGRITLRKRQNLAVIRPLGDSLQMEIMRFADEVLSGADYQFPDAGIYHDKEFEMARQLIENLSEDFDAERYTDEYKENLLKIIAAKREGESVKLEKAAEPEIAGVIDLVAKLEASLQQSGGKGKAAKADKADKAEKSKGKAKKAQKKKSAA